MSRFKKLTPQILRRIILEEQHKILNEGDPIEDGVNKIEKVKAEETDPEDLAHTLAKEIDHIKALKIKESRLLEELKLIRESQQKARKKFLAKLA